MNEAIKERWLAALRSGKYKQGRGKLKTVDDEYCCLGVLCELAVEDGVIGSFISPYETSVWVYSPGDVEHPDTESGVLPKQVAEWAGIPSSNPYVSITKEEASRMDAHKVDYRSDGEPSDSTLACLNDGGLVFNQIADVIEREL
jgi:hypothetical protein